MVTTLMTNKLRCLDLFCGAGGASMGLHRAGFEVVGVDIKPQPRYPFEFYRADALEFPLDGYDLIWASPPCQFASELTPVPYRDKHPNLIPVIRERLQAVGGAYIIENVENARRWLRTPIMLCGTMFGLNMHRHRYFEVPALPFTLTPSCNHNGPPVLISGTTRRIGANGKRNEFTAQQCRDASGLDWMTRKDMDQAVPPAYSQFLGTKIIEEQTSERANLSGVRGGLSNERGVHDVPGGDV